MSEITRQVTFEKVADRISIDSAGNVYVIGSVREKSRQVTIDTFEEDVTTLLSPQRLAEIQSLLADAQAWVDAQPFDI